LIKTYKYLLFALLTNFLACTKIDTKSELPLPFLGEPIINGNDTIPPTIKSFSFIDQDSNIITNSTFSDKIYVADFIFLSCPSICPKMNTEMLRVYNEFKNNDTVLFLSHTIDPEYDGVRQLKNFAKSIDVTSKKWHFVTGNQENIYDLAEHSYFSNAYKDSLADGGFTHTGGLLLIDKNRHIRGVYDGTNDLETNRLINDIWILLKE
jgi:protein SCO1/2